MLIANEVGGIEGGDKLITKCEKLSKLGKLFKSQKSARLENKYLKSRNSPNFGAKKNKPSFLTFNAKTVFNHLRLAFTKAPILWHFDPKYYIWIETEVLNYAISDLLS